MTVPRRVWDQRTHRQPGDEGKEAINPRGTGLGKNRKASLKVVCLRAQETGETKR